MKKKVLMIAIIILVIILAPRYNRNNHRWKPNPGHRYPGKKVWEETDDFEFPFPNGWLLINTIPDKKYHRYTPVSLFIASGYKYKSSYSQSCTGYGNYEII